MGTQNARRTLEAAAAALAGYRQGEPARRPSLDKHAAGSADCVDSCMGAAVVSAGSVKWQDAWAEGR
jgi:hypothetical protein